MLPDLLVPPPQEFESLPGAFAVGGRLTVRVDARFDGLAPALDRLAGALGGLHIEIVGGDATAPALWIRHGFEAARPQAYRLLIDREGFRIDASDSAGAAYGVCTAAQWALLHAEHEGVETRIPALRIEDWPDLRHRGVLLDISRSRVPTLDTLFDLVDLLASWKVNELQLYLEHAFAYRGHEKVWQGVSPLTADEVLKLDAYCAERHVELVPNQNSFGHLHRWLRLPDYRGLAECPEGVEHPFSTAVEPFSLCPTDPAALDFLADLYDQLLPCFTSPRFHVGFDETFDLGLGRSRERVEAVGVGHVYLEFLESVRQLVATRGRRLLCWGDIVTRHPDLIERLPADVTVMSWGYEADHPFHAEIEPLVARELEVYACPGTSSWLSFSGRADNAIANIANAVSAAVELGAVGCLLTDWGDRGHLQPLPASYPGLLGGACFAWNAARARQFETLPLRRLLETHLFGAEADGLAESLLELATLYRRTGARAFNGSPLFHLVVSPELPLTHPRLEGLDAAELEHCIGVADEARHRAAPGSKSLASREICWIADALGLGAELGLARLRGGATASAVELPYEARRGLGGALRRLIEDHTPLWLERSRTGGAAESRQVLERALARLEVDSRPDSPSE